MTDPLAGLAPTSPPFDQGNEYLQPAPARLFVAQGAPGQPVMVTIRTVGTTLTLFLSREDCDTWGKQLSAAGNPSGLIVPQLMPQIGARG